MKRLLVAAVLALSAGISFALPTVQDVETQVQRGDYARAEAMMKEVVAAKPGSARAHYVYAELLARNGRIAEAAAEAQRARAIDPALTFTGDPEKFRAFERLLQRERVGASGAAGAKAAADQALGRDRSFATPAAPARPAAPVPQDPSGPAAGGVPSWIWIAAIAGVGFMLWRRASRRRAAAAGMTGAASASAAGPFAGGPPGPGTGPGYGPGYGPVGAPVGRGGGLLGAGLAGAGGFAAGMLADRLLHGRDGSGGHDGNGGHGAGGRDALSGLGPGDDTVRFDDPAAGDIASRDVDFGTGGDDWGGDAGSVDAGGGDGGWDS